MAVPFIRFYLYKTLSVNASFHLWDIKCAMGFGNKATGWIFFIECEKNGLLGFSS